MIKSPLRYPGGKSKFLNALEGYFPKNIKTILEPMCGGASVSFFLKQIYPEATVWINDTNYNLICFWKAVRDNLEKLTEQLHYIKNTISPADAKAYFKKIQKDINEYQSDFERAVAFFVLNRSSFSGATESGGFSQQAYEKRFTASSINRLIKVAPLLKDAIITNIHYNDILVAVEQDRDCDNLFVFFDPPYDILEDSFSSPLYGVMGDQHKGFNHSIFKNDVDLFLKYTNSKVMITYNSSDKLKKLWSNFNIKTHLKIYGMSKNKKAREELIILNYEKEV